MKTPQEYIQGKSSDTDSKIMDTTSRFATTAMENHSIIAQLPKEIQYYYKLFLNYEKLKNRRTVIN